jgi:hemerythrin
MSKAPLLVAWSNEFELGMPEIDAQHQVLVDLINQVWAAIVLKPDREKALAILAELEKYTISHFAAEEIFMREIRYEQFPEHKGAHEEFVARIAEEKAKLLAGLAITLDLVRFLKDWLINHILVSDMAYALEYKKRSEPASSEPASTLGKFFKRLWG